MQSDSFETLRAAAAAGVLVSALPHRVANREDGLMEIFPDGAKYKETGQHRILVVSQASLATRTNGFPGDETGRILNRSAP